MRRPPDKRTAPEACRGGGGSGSEGLKNKRQSLTPFPAAEHLVDQLEIIADWRVELKTRMARGQLVLETIGLSTERHDKLIAEAQLFIAVCSTLAERVPGSLVEVAHERGEAA